MLPRKGKIIWIAFLPLFALGTIFLPGASWQTVLVTQVVLLPLSWFFLFDKRDNPRRALSLAALLGLACALYLSYHWYSGSVAQCGTDGCNIAQSSSYARLFFDFPTSSVGVVGYLLIIFSLLWNRLTGHILTALLGAFGLAVSCYLTYSSIFVLHTTCQWCLGSAVAMTSIAFLSYWQFVSNWDSKSVQTACK